MEARSNLAAKVANIGVEVKDIGITHLRQETIWKPPAMFVPALRLKNRGVEVKYIKRNGGEEQFGTPR